MRKIIAMILSAILMFSLSGCGGKDKKAEQIPSTAVATQETKKEVPKEEKTGFIVGTDVNAREKASTDSAIVGTFALGEKVVILAEEPEWAKVKRSDGKECYVFKKFLGNQAALDQRQARYNKKSGPYPVYLNGDPNYLLCDGHMGNAWYVDKKTLYVYNGDPKNVKSISVKVVSVPGAADGKTAISKTTPYSFTFYENNRTAEYNAEERVYYYNKINPNGPRSETMVNLGAANVAYYLVTGKAFFTDNPEFYKQFE